MPQPIFTTSMQSPAWTSSASRAGVVIPLSRTWVSPNRRGLAGRCGSSRKSGRSHIDVLLSWSALHGTGWDRRNGGPRRAMAGRPLAPGGRRGRRARSVASGTNSEGVTVDGRLVIIGGGAAGMSAASAARRVDADLEVVVLEASGYAAYGMCGIPYYLAGLVERAEDLLAYPPGYFRERRGIDLRLHAEATGFDAAARIVHYVEDGRAARLPYDRLIVAAGGAPTVPPIPGLGDPHVFTVRALEDAMALRGLLDAGRVGRALVVGAGYIGLEMAEALAERGVSVVVAELLPRVMPNLDEPLAALVEEEVRRHGVDLRLGSGLTEVRRRGGSLEAVVDGEGLPVDLVVVAAGVRAAATVAAAAGAETGPGGALLG